MQNLRKNLRKRGISPVIASIILIAVTIAIGVAIAGFTFGIFGTYSTAGGIHAIQPTTLDASDASFTTILRNDKSNPVRILSASVNVGGNVNSTDPTAWDTDPEALIPAGGGTLTVSITGAAPDDWLGTNPVFVAGTTYSFVLAFSDGSTLTLVTTAQP